MNRGLLLKSLRETWGMTALFAAFLFLVELAMGFILPTYEKQFTDQLLQLTFVQGLIRSLVGAEAGAGVGPELFQSLPWAHPVPLALAWAHAIVFCTRIPAGEVDRGTIDVLLGLPVSRWQVHLSETAVCIVSGAVLIAAGLAGNEVGGAIAGSPPPLPRALAAATNLFALYCATGALAWVFSALADRRGRAIGAAFAFVAAAFLLNYLAQVWKPLERFAWLSLMHYHRPVAIMHDGRWPVGDLAVLGAVALAGWAAAGWWFSRRDLATT